MQQAIGRNALTRSLMALALVTFFAVGVAFGQTGSLRFEIPYQFSLGSKVLPPGTYTFSTNSFGLAVQSAAGAHYSSHVITWISGPAELLRDGSLVFDKSNGSRILSEVWMPGANGLLVHSIPKDHQRDVLMGSSLGLNESHAISGKAAFELTCAKCHGADGNGNKDADKFFATDIPKLTSQVVQSKTDDELRRQITIGSSKMPPVEIDESGFRHRLPPPDVDAVIAYVRSLKK
jgi:cytochrome c553